jgi:hypothetical protein
MLNVLCVCKSGSIYDASWVEKLKNAVERNLKRPHVFTCLSDIPVPCNRIPLKHDWPGWWSKIELFRPGVIDRPTLYLDLDTIIVGELKLETLLASAVDFAMLRNFWNDEMYGSGVMWFSGETVPYHVYEKFAKQPQAYIAHHERNKSGPYVGDQAFISDNVEGIDQINEYLPGIYSYKMHCQRRLPSDASIICYHGSPRPTEVFNEWMMEHWG